MCLGGGIVWRVVLTECVCVCVCVQYFRYLLKGAESPTRNSKLTRWVPFPLFPPSNFPLDNVFNLYTEKVELQHTHVDKAWTSLCVTVRSSSL